MSTEPATLAPDEEFWRLPAVKTRTGLSKSEIYRRIGEGSFPKSRRYRSGGNIGAFWLASEIKQWQLNEISQAEQRW